MTAAPPTDAANPAGLWQRYSAWSLDAALLLIPMLLVCWPWLADAVAHLETAHRALLNAMGAFVSNRLDASDVLDPTQLVAQMFGNADIRAAAIQAQQSLMLLVLVPAVLYAALATVWHAGFESTRWQASPGKRALGLQVTDLQGARLWPGRALWRQLASAASWFSLNLGHAMIGFGPRHQALHDLLSKTRIVHSNADTRLPVWAKAWIALQLLLLFAAVFWVMQAAQTASNAAIHEMLG